MKDLAKRFFSLLYLFLTRRYRHVEIVFIRHTHEAKEVDEETFFHSRETGGTVVSTALEEMAAHRGGALPAEPLEHLRRAGLGRRQHPDRQRHGRRAAAGRASCRSASTIAYLEVGPQPDETVRHRIRRGASSLWRTYEPHRGAARRRWRCARCATGRTSIPVFRELFERRAEAAAATVTLMAAAARIRTALSEGPDWDFDTLCAHPRCGASASPSTSSASTPIRTRSR